MKKFEVYQVPMGAEYRDYRFASLEELSAMGLKVERRNYRKVHEGSLESETLEDLYSILSISAGRNMRSLSMGDIIVLHSEADSSKAFYVDRIGFREVAGF